jgi:hypothetical protein
MIKSDLEIELTFDRMVEEQFDVDVFQDVWREDVTRSYTLEETKELLELDVVTFDEVLEAALEQEWSEKDMNAHKPEPEFNAFGYYSFEDGEVEAFEKRLKKFLGIG